MQALDDLPATADAPRTPVRRRDPRVAASLSVLPGLGQLYNLQVRKALVFLLGTFASITAACMLIGHARSIAFRLIDNDRVPVYFLFVFGSLVVFLALFLIGLTLWASAVVDARRSAEELSDGRPPTGRWWLFRL